ncbi:MAG: hypothetical protein P8X39_09400, partial [Desulfofustis sp.]
MKIADTLSLYLESPDIDQFLPVFWVGLGALVCFFLMIWSVRKWKRRYQSLLDEHNRYTDKVELETQLRQEQLSLLEKNSTEMRLQLKTLAQEIFDEKTRILTHQNSD